MKTPKSIEFKILGSPDELIGKAKVTAEKYGLQFLGNIERGEIKGFGIEAHYTFREDILTITVSRKPLLLSWETVEQKVRSMVTIGLASTN